MSASLSRAAQPQDPCREEEPGTQQAELKTDWCRGKTRPHAHPKIPLGLQAQQPRH